MIDLDSELINADWPKVRMWDSPLPLTPGTVESLARGAGMTVEQYKKLPSVKAELQRQGIVLEHLPGQHDQKTHGRRHALSDSDDAPYHSDVMIKLDDVVPDAGVVATMTASEKGEAVRLKLAALWDREYALEAKLADDRDRACATYMAAYAEAQHMPSGSEADRAFVMASMLKDQYELKASAYDKARNEFRLEQRRLLGLKESPKKPEQVFAPHQRFGEMKDTIKEATDFFYGIMGDGVAPKRANEWTLIPANQRSYWSNSNNKLFIARKSSTMSCIHELGHYLEAHNLTAARMARAFLILRTGHDVAQPIPLLPKERAKFDKFHHVYCGKQYDDGSTEILSVGSEYFFKNSGWLAKHDPTYFRLMWKIFKGEEFYW